MFYMFFADGFEEVEAIAALDVIRRAKIEIKSVGISKKNITGSHGITVVCDLTESEIAPSDNCEGIILPGGMPGTENLYKSEKVNEFIDYCILGLLNFGNSNSVYLFLPLEIIICLILLFLLIKSKFNNKDLFYISMFQIITIPIVFLLFNLSTKFPPL